MNDKERTANEEADKLAVGALVAAAISEKTDTGADTAAPESPKRTFQPQKKKNKKRLILFLAVGLLLAGAAAFGLYKIFFSAEEKIAMTGKTTYGALNEAIEGSGTTTPADSITYDVSGTVLEWYAEAGAEVKEGDLLYVLDTSAVEDEILEYEVELESLYENLAETQENLNNQWVTAPFAGRVENIQIEAGTNVQNGTRLATLIDDSTMTATLYFSYAYENAIFRGQSVTVSVADQMLVLEGAVSAIDYVDYITTTGMKCFAVTIRVANPGSLTQGTTVNCWMTAKDGSVIYAVDDGELEYNRVETLTAGASGELTAVKVVDYKRVKAGETLFVIDASGYETQIETIGKQIENLEEKIADLEESIATEYSRYSDISGTIVSANYSANRMTGNHMGSITIYNQDTMQISINVDELDADQLTVGMDVTVYRTTSSSTVTYPATLSYLSLSATSGSSGVSTFAATITINSQGALSSGVTVYYSISPSEGNTEESVLAPISALCTYDDGYYLLVQRDSKPAGAIDPAAVGGSVTEYPEDYYAVPVEVGDYNGNYIQIRSGVEREETVFLRYMNAAPTGGDRTSDVEGQEGNGGMMPGGFGDFSFGEGSGMPSFGNGGGSMPSFGGSGGGMPGGSGGGMPGGMPGGQ